MRWNIFSEPTNMSEDCQALAADPTTQAVLPSLIGDRGVADEVIPAEFWQIALLILPISFVYLNCFA